VSTIRDIARLAGVSVSTASLALNDDRRVRVETRQRVLDAAITLDYHPMRAARSLSSGRTWSIHLVNPALETNMSSGFFTRFLRGIHDVARDGTYTLTLTAPEDEHEARSVLKRLVAERWSDGVVLMNPTEHDGMIEDVIATGFPHVLLGRSPIAGVTTVDNDNAAAAYDATAHLIERGRRSLLLVNGPAYRTFTQDRARGFVAACSDAHVDAMHVVNVEGPAEATTRAIAEHVAAGRPLDGVVAVSDPQAIVTMRALLERGMRVPRDVAIIGMNNDDLTLFTHPSLSTVDLNAYDLGRSAAEALLARIDGGAASGQHRLVPHEVIARESSA
jgi:DNA-binding LacI/PurR family transcriptional regulator